MTTDTMTLKLLASFSALRPVERLVLMHLSGFHFWVITDGLWPERICFYCGTYKEDRTHA